MHRSETDDEVLCVSCGTVVTPEERIFAINDDDVLCFDCAMARSGSYDEQKDLWLRQPSLDGLHLTVR